MNRVLFSITASLGFFAIVMLYFAGMRYQQGSLALGEAFSIMRYSAYIGIVAVVAAIIFLAWKRPGGIKLILLLSSAVLGFVAFYMPYNQQKIAGSVPPIHDISTDLVNPPQFFAVAPLRADAPNPVEYAGPETAAQQRDAYPDITSINYSQSNSAVFGAANAVAINMGWKVVDANQADGRIEATATTRWFGFKDDVVIRINTKARGGTVLDMRSKSRVGRSDVGVNAARIRDFIEELNNQLDI